MNASISILPDDKCYLLSECLVNLTRVWHSVSLPNVLAKNISRTVDHCTVLFYLDFLCVLYTLPHLNTWIHKLQPPTKTNSMTWKTKSILSVIWLVIQKIPYLHHRRNCKFWKGKEGQVEDPGNSEGSAEFSGQFNSQLPFISLWI